MAPCCGVPVGRRGGGRRDVESVLRDAEAGSPVALAAFAEVGRWLGIGLAGLVNVLNPEVIVLGGLFGRIQPFVRPGLSTARLTGWPCLRRVASSGSSRRSSGSTPR